MAEIVNDRDLLIMAAVPRFTPPTDRGMFLTPPAAVFRASGDGSTSTPPSFTFKATLLNMAGVVSFAASNGAKLTVNATKNEATLDFAAFAAAGVEAVYVTATITVDGVPYTQQAIVTKVSDGAQGVDGAQTAVARLYQFSTTVPSKPAGSSTFTWAGAWNGAYTGTDGWGVTVPANPGTPNLRLYVASVSVSGAAKAATTPVSYTGATVEAWSQNGAKGDAGVSGVQSGVATVYQWAATIPAGPAGNALFRWASNAFGEAPAGWALAPGAAPSLGMTLWAASVKLVDAATNGDTAFNWSSASIMAIGYAGTNGGPGQQGASYVTAYCATTVGTGTSAPAPTKGRNSLPAANSGGLTGSYSANVPALSAGQYQMQTDGIYDPTTDMITWSIPYQSSLKVATLSAITANLGAINGGSISLGNGTFTVDNSGNLVCYSIKIVDPNTGKTVFQAGGKFNPEFLPNEVQNSGLSLGGNLCYNADFANGMSGWGVSSNDGSCKLTITSATALGETGTTDWTLNRGLGEGTNTVQVHQTGANGSPYYEIWSDLIPVQAGKRYCVSAYTGAHNCTVDVFAYTFDSTGNGIVSNFGAGADTNVNGAKGGILLGGYKRHQQARTINDGEAFVRVVLRKYPTSVNSDSWMMACRAQLEEVGSTSNTAGPWSQSGTGKVVYSDIKSAAKTADWGTGLAGRPADSALLNSAVSIDTNGRLLGAGGGQVQNLPVVDGARSVNYAPRDYGVVHIKEFKACNSIGLSADVSYYCTLETMKQWSDSSGGYAIQWAYVGDQTYKRSAPCDAASWGAWIRDMDRSYYTGDLNASWGANQSNLNVGLGARNLLNNTLPNTLLTATGGYSSTFADGGSGNAVAYYGPGHEWGVFAPENRGCVGVRTVGNVGSRADIYYAPRVTVTPNQRYEFSSTASAHRCRAWACIAWYRADGSYISEVGGAAIENYAWNTGWVGSPAPRVLVFGVAPADAVVAMPFLRMTKTGGNTEDSYLFASQLYMGEALSSQTVGSPYSPGLMEARDLAIVAQNGLQNKIDANASSILRAPITITTGGGIVVGSLIYDATNGLRGGGSGIAITPYGIIGHDGNKYTFGISGGTGAAFFGGELQAAYGTFGALRIAPGGYIAQGDFSGAWAWPAVGGRGYLFHQNGILFGNANDPNQFYFQLDVATSGIYMPGFTYAGRQLTLDTPAIINPKLTLANRTVSIASPSGTSFSHPRATQGGYCGSHTASISNAVNPTYLWTAADNVWGKAILSNPTAATCGITVVGPGGRNTDGMNIETDFYVTCTISDGGVTQSATVDIDVSFY